MALRISTTGSDVMIHDLGINVPHPTVNRDLSLEFTAMELKKSEDLTEAIASGDLTVDDGSFAIHASDYDPDELLLQDLGIRGDEKYISNDELGSIGVTEIMSGIFPLSLNSTAQSTRNVYANGARWVTWELEPGDIVTIVDNTASGHYTVEEVSDQQNFIVEEPILDSTGGTVSIYHPVGATRVGVDSSEMDWSDSDNLQEVLEDLIIATSSGINEYEHRTLDQLVHDIAEDSFEEIIRSTGKITNLITWTDNTKTTKIREESYSYSSGKISTATTIQFDGDGLEVERTVETYTYSGVHIISIDREYI